MFCWARILGLCLLACTPLAGAQLPQQQNVGDLELKLGQQVYEELCAKGELIHSSPLYDTLNPIATAIIKIVQPQYQYPFKFFLVHEKQPNAFAAPGGNVYVTDSLMYFVKNTEELAGTLCHETSHTLHHDAVTLMKEDEEIKRRALAAEIIMERRNGRAMPGIPMLAKLRTLSYSRDSESRADITGSDTCAKAGYNPWGLVWLLQDFEDHTPEQRPQMLSDHPSDQNRVTALKAHFAENPETFSKFPSDPKTATALAVPKSAAPWFH